MARHTRSTPILPLLLTVAALAACAERAPTPATTNADTATVEHDAPTVEVMEGSSAPCTFTPAQLSVAVGSTATVHPAGGCARVPRKAVLTWEGNGPAPAGIGPRGCAAQEGVATMVVKVARCAPGKARLTIYTDSTKTTKLQEIEIVDP